MLIKRRALAAGLVGAVLVLAGCGVPLQGEPAPLQVTPAPSPPSPSPSGSSVVRVYLIRKERLVEEVRNADDPSTQSVLELLAEGPTAAEEVVGTTTAVASGEYAVTVSSGGATVIDVPLQFTQVAGDLQLLAAAQLVWTATDRQPRSAVRMTFEGKAIELPTDRGLTRGPVRRADYQSVAPAAD